MDTSRNESTSPTLFTYSNSQSQQPDISQDFHRCIVKVADGLNDEVTKEKIRYLYKPQLGSGEYRTALSMLDKLQEKGVFSERNVEPLKTLLKDCDRHDLLTQFVNEYRKTDVYAASAMQADPGEDENYDNLMVADLLLYP